MLGMMLNSLTKSVTKSVHKSATKSVHRSESVCDDMRMKRDDACDAKEREEI